MDADDLRGVPLLEGLDESQLAELAARGTEVAVQPGTVVFREGEHAEHWWLLLDGAIELCRRVGNEDVQVAKMDVAGRWAGGFRAWDEQGVYLATGRGAVPSRLLSVPAVELRALLDEWFPFGGHLVRGLYHTARTIESTARQRSALVTLGTLAAGLAHELNNPASAATRAVDVLSDACTAMFSSLGRLADVDVSGERLAALDALRRELDPKRADPDPLARADAEETVAAWLAGHRISAEWVLARALVGAGADAAWCERVAAALP
ncbi:MAG: cyclic nucleotide-binding domain-containing protein, partial [Nocardioidaceae bacterium]|nr:cyclic nucleotide-binding domain-containing protein [Nocardioidaceae bacterium]